MMPLNHHVHQLGRFSFATLAAVLYLSGLIGCTQREPLMTAPQVPPAQQGLSDVQVRQLAIKFRDAWLVEGKDEAASILAGGTIVAIERQPAGWHVTFKTPTGHSQPEGVHDYYLHVYLKPSGDLDRIVRGPDMLT